MGSIVLDGAKIESGSIIAAGSVVAPRTTIPSGQVWAGSPAKFLRKLEPEETEFLAKSASNYAQLADVHRCEWHGLEGNAVCRAQFDRSVAAMHVLNLFPCCAAVENGKTFEELAVESRIEVDRFHASDPLNTIHQMYELDAQTLLATKTKK